MLLPLSVPRLGTSRDDLNQGGRRLPVCFVAGPALATLIIPFVDQWIRNWVDNVTSAPDTFDSLAITPKEYAQLPIYWRQALAEIPLLSKEEARGAQNIIEGLRVEDIRLIDRIAPYIASAGLVRERGKLSEHPMPELSYAHFSHLQNLGILEDVNDGRVITLNEPRGPGGPRRLRGTTVLLTFEVKDPETKATLETTAFTAGGRRLVDSLRVPSNIPYFEWIAKELERKGFTVDLVSLGPTKGELTADLESQARIERATIALWPPEI